MPSFISLFEDTAPFFVYNGDWIAGSDSIQSYSESTVTATQQPNASLTFQYYGTGAIIVGTRKRDHGLYQVTVDGEVYPEGVGRSLSSEFNVTLFENKLDQRVHSVSLVNKESAWLDVDYIAWETKIGLDNETLVVDTIQDSHPSFVYRPENGWTTSPPLVASFSGRSGHGTSRQGATAEVPFSGDCIALFGFAGSNGAGSYSVQVDGEPPRRFSALRQFNHTRQLLYWAGGLGAGDHKLRIRMDSSVSTEVLAIDYAEVYTTPSLRSSSNSQPETTPSQQSEPTARLPTGAIVGLAIASVVAVFALCALGIILLLNRRRKRRFDVATIDDLTEAPSVVEVTPFAQHYSSNHNPVAPLNSANIGTSSTQNPTGMSRHLGHNANVGSVSSGSTLQGSSARAEPSQQSTGAYQKFREASGHAPPNVGRVSQVRRSEAPPAYDPGDHNETSRTG